MTTKISQEGVRFSISKKVVVFISSLCVAGFVVALYLAWLHHQVHSNPSFHSFCAMSDAFNCETVAESPYSVFLGLPIAVWGLLGYTFMFFCASIGVGRYNNAGAYLLLLIASTFSVLSSVVLALISHCIICSFCIMCCVTYGINTMIFLILIWQTVRCHFPIWAAASVLPYQLRRQWTLVATLLLCVFFVYLVFPKYWGQSHDTSRNKAQQGSTREGHYWIGAESPALTIVEFSDYLCPHCRRAHMFQRHLVSANPETLRLIHRHFPLDNACNPLIKNPFHPGACLLARASLCAGKQRGFWEMNDLLYDSSTLKGTDWQAKMQDAAERIGLDLTRFRECLSSDETQNELEEDIAEGLRLNLRGTPSFVINGQVHLGMPDSSIYQEYGISTPTK